MLRPIAVRRFQEARPLLRLARPVVRHDDFFGLRGGARDSDGHKVLAFPEPFRKLEQKRVPVPLVYRIPWQRQLMYLALTRDAFRKPKAGLSAVGWCEASTSP